MWASKTFYNKTVDKKRGFGRKVVACIFSDHYTDTSICYEKDWSYTNVKKEITEKNHLYDFKSVMYSAVKAGFRVGIRILAGGAGDRVTICYFDGVVHGNDSLRKE